MPSSAASQATGVQLTTGNNLPPPQSPFVNQATGFLSNDGYLYLLGIINQLQNAVPTSSIATGLEAQGTTQSTALQLTSQWNEITSAIGGGTNGVLLDAFQPGQAQSVFNNSGVTINVYPPPGAKINSLGVNVAYSLTNGSRQTFQFLQVTQISAGD